MNPRILIVIFLLLVAAGMGFPSLSVEPPPINRNNDAESDTEPDAVRTVRTELAAQLGIGEADVLLLEVREAEWPDSCLGLAGPEELCAQVITPGYEVLLRVQGKEYRYRMNSEGTVVRPAGQN